ncbi:MAG TPA: NADPH-dependent FMN reductase [Alphaproteobacteria bacterium]|nr:NADPH-dependent FMN reductase [Alphaproteobacteria bacterium]
MTKIIGIAGSLRKSSYNAALLRAAATLAPEGVSIEVASIAGIPLYDGDLEASAGIPEPVARLKDAIAAADGLILATPEYNNSIPGVFKNAVDWLTRPAADIPRVFGGKPVAIIGASSGNFGTILGQNGWLPVLRVLGTKPWFGGRLLVPRAQSAFDGAGMIADEALKQRLRQFIEGFAAFIGAPSS